MSSIRTPIGMMSFPQLFVPKAAVPGGELRFSLNLILTAASQRSKEYKALVAAARDTIDEKWGVGKGYDEAWLAKNRIRLPFRSTSERDYTGYDIEGGVFIAPWSKNKPGIVDVTGKNDILVPSDIWSGQLIICTVHPFPYDTQGNKGVGFNLNNVQVVKADMPRLDGRKAAKDEFTDMSDYEGAGAGAGSTQHRADPPF